MNKFQFVRARSVDEAVEALATTAGRARPIAGGTDLIVQLAEGRKTADRVVALDRVPELGRIDAAPDVIRIGAAAPCSTVYSHPSVKTALPMLAEAASLIGSVQIQNRASLGGNVCNAAPSADSIPALICLDARAVIAGPDGQRELPVEQFCTGPGQTALKPDELLVALQIAAPGPREAGRYLRFIPRNEMDIAVVGAGVQLRLSPDRRRVENVRIALASVAPTPIRAIQAEEVLTGETPSKEALERAAELAQEASRPISDVRASADYRRHLVKVLVKRALEDALRRAGAIGELFGGEVAIGG